jgi:hypothetical protein
MRVVLALVVIAVLFVALGGSDMLADMDIGLPAMPHARGVMHR